MGLLSQKRKRDHFTQKQHPIQNQKKNCRIVSPQMCIFTGSTSRENYLSNAKLKLFEESKTIVGYFKTQIFLGAKVLF